VAITITEAAPDAASVPVPHLLTTSEAADYLSVSARTVKQLMTAGRLHYVKIGRATRIDRRDLDNFVAQNRRKQRNPRRQVS
jgi:excisionase family DNA binding protein